MSGDCVEILLDGRSWRTPLDFYQAILPQIGAPEWHGTNLNALDDSLVFGGMNSVRPPFRFRLSNIRDLPADIREELKGLVEIVERGRDEYGLDIDIEVEGGI